MTIPPITPFSIEFVNTIIVYDPVSNQPSNNPPQWLRAAKQALIAYPRASALRLSVTFLNMALANYHQPIEAISAQGHLIQIPSTSVALRFNQESGISQAILCTSRQTLPDQVGLYAETLHWYAQVGPKQLYLGATEHTIAISFAPMQVNVSAGFHDWVYEPLLRWACTWARGLAQPKAICDALIQQLAQSGLSYGREGPSTTRSLLLRGSGLCGAWYRLFQQLGHSQGIVIERRDFTLVTAEGSRDQDFWDAIATNQGGLNQAIPAAPVHEYTENNQQFPIAAQPAALIRTIAHRYVFSGQRSEHVGTATSTHALNFLQTSTGEVYLYDPSFGFGPLLYGNTIPAPGSWLTGEDLDDFKTNYLDLLFDYLIGSIWNGDQFYQTKWGSTPQTTIYGMLVDIKLVEPDMLMLGWSINGLD